MYISYIYNIAISYIYDIYTTISKYIPVLYPTSEPCLGPERFLLLQGAQGLGQAQRTLQGDRLGQRQQRLA
jgi:hypothetical protein